MDEAGAAPWPPAMTMVAMAPISPEIEKIVCGHCSMAIDRLALDLNNSTR
jgi:hypothetical protein